ncbi:hypothetical protein PTT_15355 [Pyrenophora teres f. teres 0-1]|uniref:Uncharacterized protein n=1 Tax=Pyrenophora teres f. teres (strain 0-1) TaxID=861557 RepID=E3S019_PYRTT|nr:hypothetical protein PTT_18641 [Pyrenophora teres f. teres 0-1]EFQ88671.1 hypothetical protein PTT_15355 [Pyrenophora teres f. teres 0-1]
MLPPTNATDREADRAVSSSSPPNRAHLLSQGLAQEPGSPRRRRRRRRHHTITAPYAGSATSGGPLPRRPASQSAAPVTPSQRIAVAPTNSLTAPSSVSIFVPGTAEPLQRSKSSRNGKHWELLPARVHHKDDDVTHYGALGSRSTWEAAHAKRLLAAEAEVGRVDTKWDGGVIVDYSAQDRKREERARGFD